MMTTDTNTFKFGGFDIHIWTIEGEENDDDGLAGTLTVMTRINDGQSEAYTPEQFINCLMRSIKNGKVVEPHMMMLAAAYIAHNAAFTRENYVEEVTESE